VCSSDLITQKPRRMRAKLQARSEPRKGERNVAAIR